MGNPLDEVRKSFYGRSSLVAMTVIDVMFILALIVLFVLLDKGKTWITLKMGPLSAEGQIVVGVAEVILDLILLVSVLGWLVRDVRCKLWGDCHEPGQ